MAENRYSDADFKLRKLSSGDINKVTNENAINQSLTSLFNTIPGERYNNLDYGSNLFFLLFEPFDELTSQAIASELNESIQRWEGARIEVEELEVTTNYEDTVYEVYLSYKIKSTTQTGELSLILPKK